MPAPSRERPPSEAHPDQHWAVSAQRRVWRYLRCLGCANERADDLTQDALLAALARWPEGEPPLAWILATARNLWRLDLRRRGRRREIEGLDRLHDRFFAEVGDDGGDAALLALRSCLGLLAPRAREVLELRYRDGLDRDAIAVRTALGVEGVKSVLQRARAALRECIEKWRKHDER